MTRSFSDDIRALTDDRQNINIKHEILLVCSRLCLFLIL